MPWQDFVVGFQIANETLEEHSNLAQKESYNAVMFALRGHFGEGYVFIRNFMSRFNGLVDLVSCGELEPWLLGAEQADKPRTLHPALLLAASDVRMTRTGRFPSKRFRARVDEIIRTEGNGDMGTQEKISD